VQVKANLTTLIGLLLCLPWCYIAEADEFPVVGEWPCFQGNGTLDGRASGTGRIRHPQVAWRHRFGATVTKIAVSPADEHGQRSLTDVGHELRGQVDSARWFHTPMGEIAGKEQAIAPGDTTTYADILPNVSGLEKIEFESGFNLPTKNGQWQYGPGRLLAWRDNHWDLVWEVEALDLSFRPLPLVGDFDADGQLEVAVLPWRAVFIYDAVTGELEQRCEFTKGRCYGFFGVYDFDDDGRYEFLVMSDFAKHIDVLGWRDGELALLWQEEIELDIANPQKILRVLAEPVADLEGDDKPEIIVNLYNAQGDRRWHLTVRDALTGAIKAELQNVIAQGIADVEGDGTTEILAAVTDGRHVPILGTVQILRLADQGLPVIWQGDEMAWECQETPVVLHQQNGAQAGRIAALTRRVRDQDVVVTRSRSSEDPGSVDLSVQRWDGSQLRPEPTLVARHAEVLALDSTGSMLAAVHSVIPSDDQVQVRHGELEILTSAPGEMRMVTPPAVAHVAGQDTPLIVAQDTSLLSWSIFQPPTSAESSRELRRVADGRPTYDVDSSAGQDARPNEAISALSPARRGPVIANLRGNGQRELLIAVASERGSAELLATDLSSGTVVWRHEFDRFSAGRHAWNFGGPLYWQTGYFTNDQRQDVLVTLQRSRMHSEETYLVSGETGQVIWHRDRQIASRSFGGQPFAIADFDGNGWEDAASFYTHIRYIVDGATGEDLLAEENVWPEVPLQQVYWGQPVAGHFESNSEIPSLLFTTTRNQMVGLIRADGNLVWSDAYDKAANGFPAVGDFDADDQLEVIYFGFPDGTRCYDTATGNLEWSLALAAGQQISAAVSGDINGDGRDEAVIALGKTLICVGVDQAGDQGIVLWKLDLPTLLSSPILADIGQSNESYLSILVSGQDGCVYCIDDAEAISQKLPAQSSPVR